MLTPLIIALANFNQCKPSSLEDWLDVENLVTHRQYVSHTKLHYMVLRNEQISIGMITPNVSKAINIDERDPNEHKFMIDTIAKVNACFKKPVFDERQIIRVRRNSFGNPTIVYLKDGTAWEFVLLENQQGNSYASTTKDKS